jgi:uncharacterized protein (DUF1501 family)
MRIGNLQSIRTRRNFLQSCVAGIETAALAHLLSTEGRAAEVSPLAPKSPPLTAKAKNVIFLFMEGGPSQLDLFDPKPELQKWHGQSLPPSMTKDLKLAFIKPSAKVLGSSAAFRRYGASGMELSDYIPNTAAHSDDICLVRSAYTEAFNHHPGQLMLMTGATQVGRPTLGAWVTYGLGSESANLPAFVVLSSGKGTSAGSANWSSGFLPSTYQGVPFRNTGDPILYLANPPGISRETQRARLNALKSLNERAYADTGDIEVAARIESYELAFRMQMAAPELLDLSKESAETLAMYGADREPTRPYGTNCLLARRMVERGVRFIMLAHASWDDHEDIKKGLTKNCAITDQPVGALLTDLKRRGLLDSTLVIWGGEFGRTPLGQFQKVDEGPGRDHHPDCFSIWMAGGGIKGGQIIGRTDDLGLKIVENPVHIHDLQATVLRCLGFDHTRLTYRHMGRDFRLTDVGGRVVDQMLA